MKLKMVVVDLELSRNQRRLLVAVVGAGLLAAGATSALADVPNTLVAGQTLKADDLNENFDSADERLSALEEAPSYLVSTSSELRIGALGGDLVYDAIEVDLTPGTWLVEGYGTLHTAPNDATQLGLWDQTNLAEIPDSRGAVAMSVSRTDAGCGASYCLPAPGSTSAVITVAANTTIRIKAYVNGNAVVAVGAADGLGIDPVNRITAVRLR